MRQEEGCPFLDQLFQKLQALLGQIIPWMAFEAEVEKLSQGPFVALLQDCTRCPEKIQVAGRVLRPGVHMKGFPAFDVGSCGEIAETVSVVKPPRAYARGFLPWDSGGLPCFRYGMRQH